MEIFLTEDNYATLYKPSIEFSSDFWLSQSEKLDWFKRPTQGLSGSFDEGQFTWFEDGQLNVSVNCIDRHLKAHSNKIALYWEGDDPADQEVITYQYLHEQVCRLSNVFKERGIQKGDRVCIYMPLVPEACFAMLACARIGAVHTVVFGGFSPDSIRDRIVDADCALVITSDVGFRAGKALPYKSHVDEALQGVESVHTVIVLQTSDDKEYWQANRDVDYHEAMAEASQECEPEIMNGEDPLFILYTSGSTGKPKGVLHTTGGYLLYAMLTLKFSFDLKEEDVYWCTADVGWITGHSYVVYGPLANAATSVIFSGVPTYPNHARWWEMIDRYHVSLFYTAPTAIRALMAQGDEPLKSSSRDSLRVLGTVGEPINPESWHWYFKAIGHERCPIQDTWWQTETGGFMMAPPLKLGEQKPGACMRPMLGIQPALMGIDGREERGETEGALVIKQPWPGMMRTIYGDHQRFIETYLSAYPGCYFSGDGARRDQDGDYWITGRMDDVLNVSGHRLSTAEIESALVLHEAVAESAVVGYEHNIKGQGIYAFVTLMKGVVLEDGLDKQLIQHVRKTIGPVVTIDVIQFAPDLPKTRSGKIMRRILRKIAGNECEHLGDTSTLSNPDCVAQLIKNRIEAPQGELG